MEQQAFIQSGEDNATHLPRSKLGFSRQRVLRMIKSSFSMYSSSLLRYTKGIALRTCCDARPIISPSQRMMQGANHALDSDLKSMKLV